MHLDCKRWPDFPLSCLIELSLSRKAGVPHEGENEKSPAGIFILRVNILEGIPPMNASLMASRTDRYPILQLQSFFRVEGFGIDVVGLHPPDIEFPTTQLADPLIPDPNQSAPPGQLRGLIELAQSFLQASWYFRCHSSRSCPSFRPRSSAEWHFVSQS